MKQVFIFYFLILHLLFVCGQNIRTIQIEEANARPLNLSEIAEKVTPIALEKSGMIQNIFLTNEYLFIASVSSVVHYDLSGKFIREIDCGGLVTHNVTGDVEKKELYVPVGNKIKCYDFSGIFKREYSLNASSLYCLNHKGILWVQSYQSQPDKGSINKINKINVSTGEIITLPFEVKYDPVQIENGSLMGIGAVSCLSFYNDDVVVSFDRDNALYKIQHDNTTPFIQWNISPPAQSNDIFPMRAHGFIGEYLFINYRRNGLFYIYLEDIKTDKKYNVRNFVDDIFNSNGGIQIYSTNQVGYFYFFKERGDFTGNNVGNMPLKNGPVIFIVKAK